MGGSDEIVGGEGAQLHVTAGIGVPTCRDDDHHTLEAAARAIGTIRRLERTAPRSAGLAGILFSVLFVASLLLASSRPSAGLDESAFVDWFRTQGLAAITISALYMAPFAGIAFLWFIGVIRHRIGTDEDQFFATVQWIVLLFPAWVCVASGYILVAEMRTLRRTRGMAG